MTLLTLSSSLESEMSHYLVEQLRSLPNIIVLGNSEVIEARGKDRLESICILNRSSGEVRTVPAAAMFIFIGAEPRTEMLKGLVERDPAGFVLTGPDLATNGGWPKSWPLKRDPYLLETSCPGIFAAGDVRHGSIKRVASAVGEGSTTVALVHQYLRTV